jgi:hypothetical protein
MRTSRSGRTSGAIPKRATSITRLGVAGLALAALAACSSSAGPTSMPRAGPTSMPRAGATSLAASTGASGTSAWRSHPCALLTGAEASAALGQRVTVFENAAGGICQYIQADHSTAIAFIETAAADWPGCKYIVTNGSNPPVPVGGIGDEALWDAGVGDLCVRSGGLGLLVGIGGPKRSQSPDHGLAMAEILARLMLPRL